MATEAEYAAFLDLLYGAPVEQNDWEPVIARFADLIGAHKAWMPELDLTNGGGRGVLARIDPSQQETYFQYFASRNPFVRPDIDRPNAPWPLTVKIDEDYFAREEFTRTEYFNDFLKPQDIHWTLIVRLARQNGVQSTLNVTRPSHQERFSGEELEIVRRLHPHIIRAFNLSRRFADLGAFNTGLTEALDRSLHGVLLLDGEGRIKHANAVADRLLKEGDGLRVVGGRLSAWRGEPARQLEALIGQAARRDGASRTGGSMALSTASRSLALSLIVAPLRSERLLTGNEPCVLVCVTDLEAGVSLPVRQICTLFGLTPAEGRVALALFEGATPQEAAAQFGVSPHTVHVQIAHIFKKTGTNRQTELIRLMMRTVTERLD